MLFKFLLVFVLGTHVVADHCDEKDAELSPDETSFYIPSRCTSLKIDGDHSRLDLLIAALDMHPSLTSLNLARDPWRAYTPGGVDSYEIHHLLEILPQTNIEILNLAFNVNIGDEGIKLISEKLHELTTLKELNIQTTGFETMGYHSLIESLYKDHSYLEKLNIARNAFGEGHELIDVIKEHSHLKHINDEGTRLKSPESEVGHAVRTLLKGQCVVSKWSDWSQCGGTCGSHNTVFRTREVIHRPHKRHLNMNEECPHKLKDHKHCIVRCNQHGEPMIKPPSHTLAHHKHDHHHQHQHDHQHKHDHKHQHHNRGLTSEPETAVEDVEETMVEDVEETVVEDVEETMVEEVEESVVEDVEETAVEDVEETMVEDVEETVVEDVEETMVEDVEERVIHKYKVAEPIKTTRKA